MLDIQASNDKHINAVEILSDSLLDYSKPLQVSR